MAKRKKLNKRVAILLGAIGAVLVALVLTLAIRSSGSGGLLNRLFPKDPVVLLKKAQDAAEAKDNVKADLAFQEAINAARNVDPGKIPEYYYQYAKFNYDWFTAGTGLTRTQQGERLHEAAASLQKALGRDPNFLKAREFLTEIFWNHAGGTQNRGWNEFIKEADELIKLKGDDHLTYFRRGLAKVNLVSVETPGPLAKEAIDDLEKAISLKKDEVNYRLALIGFLRRLEGRDAEVEQAFQKAVEAMPGNARLLIAYASYLQENKRPDEARQRLEEAIAKDPVQGNIALADFYSLQGKLDDSLKALETARRIDPSDGGTYLRKATIFARQAQVLAAAAREATAEAATRPAAAGATQPTSRPDSQAAEKTAEAIAVLKEGLAAVEKAAATQPAGRQHNIQAASRRELYYQLADLLLDAVERGDKDRPKLLAEAADCLRSMTLLGLAGPLRAKVSGRIAWAQGKAPEAIEELETAFTGLGTQDMKTANLLVNIYLGQKLPGKADAVLDKLLSVPGQQRNTSILMAKARLLIQYRDFDKADRVITQVLQLEPTNGEAISTRMMILAVRGQTPSLTGKGQFSPEATRLLLESAATLWLDQRREDAIKLVEQLHQNAPKDRVVTYRLFSMYRDVERMDDAEKLLDDAQRYWPDDKTIEARRRLLREKDPAKQLDILMQMAEEYPEPQRSIQKATVAQTMGRPDEYIKYLRQAAKVDPNDPDVVERLFRWSVEMKDWKQAADAVSHARKANLDGAGGKVLEARMDVSKQDYDAAIAACLEALKTQPNRKDARVLLGQAYLQKRMLDPAYEEFKTVANNDPTYVPALVGLVAATGAQGKTDERRAWVEAAYRLASQDPFIRKAHFDSEQETTSPEDQIKEREKLLKREPNDLAGLASLGGLYERVGRAKDAEDMFLTLHDKSPDKLYSARVLCAFYLRKGRLDDVERVIEPLLESKVDPVGVRVLYGELILQQDPVKAKALLEKAITANVNDPRGHLGMARYWVAMRDWPRAVDCMTTYVRLSPQDQGGVKELVRYAIEAGDNALAEKRIEEMLQVDPSDAGAITLKGSLALRKGQTQRAMDLYTKAIQDNQNFAEPLILRARLFLVLGDANRAKADLQAAKRLSNRLDVSMQLVEVYLGLQDFDNAELVLRELRATFPSYGPAIDQLINIYLQRQKWRELEELLAEAKKAYPTNPGYWLAEAHMWALRQDEVKKLEAHAQAVKVAPMTVRPVRDYLIALQEAKKYDAIIQASEPYVGKEGFVGWVDAFRATALAKTNHPAEADKAFLSALQVAQPTYVLILVRQLQDAYGAADAPAKFDAWLAGDQAKNWRLYLVLGVLYGEANESAKAVEALSKARELANDPLARFLAWRHLGSTWYAMGKFAETEKAYLECIKLRDDDVQVLNNLAYLYTNDLNQPRKGLPLAEKAAQLSPDNARILDTYGWTLAKLDKMSDAEGALVRAVQLEAPLAVSRYHLGWIYEHTVRLDDALKQYRQGFEMVRTNKDDSLYTTLKEAVERVTKKLEAGSKK